MTNVQPCEPDQSIPDLPSSVLATSEVLAECAANLAGTTPYQLPYPQVMPTQAPRVGDSTEWLVLIVLGDECANGKGSNDVLVGVLEEESDFGPGRFMGCHFGGEIDLRNQHAERLPQ